MHVERLPLLRLNYPEISAHITENSRKLIGRNVIRMLPWYNCTSKKEAKNELHSPMEASCAHKWILRHQFMESSRMRAQ